MNYGTSQFLHSPPLSQAGRLDGLEDGSGSAAPQSRVDGRQCPLVKTKIHHIYLAACVLRVCGRRFKFLFADSAMQWTIRNMHLQKKTKTKQN